MLASEIGDRGLDELVLIIYDVGSRWHECESLPLLYWFKINLKQKNQSNVKINHTQGPLLLETNISRNDCYSSGFIKVVFSSHVQDLLLPYNSYDHNFIVLKW